MKVPPKRKGNPKFLLSFVALDTLNESPSEKEGKCTLYQWNVAASELPQ